MGRLGSVMFILTLRRSPVSHLQMHTAHALTYQLVDLEVCVCGHI